MALAAAKADSPGAMHTGAADMMSRIVFVAFTSCAGAGRWRRPLTLVRCRYPLGRAANGRTATT